MDAGRRGKLDMATRARGSEDAFGEKRIGEVRAQLGRIVATVDGFVGTDEAEPPM
jgi:hypothetical protein